MRLIKMLGLASVAAIAAMAFIGVGSASAVLCKVNQEPCQTANQYPVPTEAAAKSTATELTNALGFVTLCESSTVLKHEGVSGSKLLGKIVKLEWTNCTGCTTVETTTLGKFTDEATGSGNAKLLPEGTVVLLKKCPLGVECTATAITGTTVLALSGGAIGSTANATANTNVALSGGGICGSTGTWKTQTGHQYIVTNVNGSTTGSIFQE